MLKTNLAIFAATVLLSAAASASPTQTSDSSSQSPYLIPARNNVFTRSIITVGDAVNYKADGVTPYRMVGIPDGLGAFDNGNGTFTVLMNHEHTNSNGIVRDHGFAGAFVSRWIIEKGSLTAQHGEDLIKSAFRWDVAIFLHSALVSSCTLDAAVGDKPHRCHNHI